MMETVSDTEEECNLPPKSWARLKRRAMSALHYHVPFTEEDACKVAKEYLMAGLQHVRVENFDQEEISLILKAEEDILVLGRAGFLPN